MGNWLRVLAILAFPAAAAAAGRETIVDTHYVLRAAYAGTIVWDVRRADEYDKGHIPGAVNIDHVARTLIDEKTQLFPPLRDIERRLGGAGIDPRKPIIVYGARGSSYAHFAAFALEALGARDVRVLSEGYEGWKDARRHTTTRATGRAPVRLKLTPNPKVLVTTEEVVERLGQPNVQLLDVRRSSEWSGEESETLHSGHLPGAIHIPYNLAYIDPDTPAKLMKGEVTDTGGMSLKPDAELAALYANLDPARETIVYCHTGIRAALTAHVLARLGFRNVKVYHASWYEYGNLPDARVER
jgi:thiosulfate/3-mercaptopyruvate sulfurtransferase